MAALLPVAEELTSRGALSSRLKRLRWDPWLVIDALAAVWAALRCQSAVGVIAMIFVKGLLLGAARRQTGSVVTSILMHMHWSFQAIW